MYSGVFTRFYLIVLVLIRFFLIVLVLSQIFKETAPAIQPPLGFKEVSISRERESLGSFKKARGLLKKLGELEMPPLTLEFVHFELPSMSLIKISVNHLQALICNNIIKASGYDFKRFLSKSHQMRNKFNANS